MSPRYLIIVGLCVALAACQYLSPKPEIIYLSEPSPVEPPQPECESDLPSYLVYASLPLSPVTTLERPLISPATGVIAIPQSKPEPEQPIMRSPDDPIADSPDQSPNYLVQLGTFIEETSLKYYLEQISNPSVNFSIRTWADRWHGQRYAVLHCTSYKSYADALAEFEAIRAQYNLTTADFWIRNGSELKAQRPVESAWDKACR